MNNSKQDKYNPDVVKKYESLTRDRESSTYTFSKQVYKGITNDFPNQITKPEDLKIKSSEPDFDLIKKSEENPNCIVYTDEEDFYNGALVKVSNFNSNIMKKVNVKKWITKNMQFLILKIQC